MESNITFEQELDDIVSKGKSLSKEQYANLVKDKFKNIAGLIQSDIGYKSKAFSKYRKEEIIKYTQNPVKFEKKLREVSLYLYSVSLHYQRLVNYFATIGVDEAWELCPYWMNSQTSDDNFNSYYDLMLKKLSVMNIPHEYGKIKKTLWIEGVFYGYETHLEDSYIIKKLDPNFCRIVSSEDGVNVFAFDFNYFNSRLYELDLFPEEFKIKYDKYVSIDENNRKKKIKDLRWQILDTSRAFAIKMDENIPFIFPPFMGLFLDIYSIQDYKELTKAKEELKNYVVLAAKIPLSKEGKEPDDFLLDVDTALEYGQMAMNQLPDQWGFVLSPYEDMQLLTSNQTSSSDMDATAQAETNMWAAAGVNKNMFSGEANTEGTLDRSINSDESTVFIINRQFERWINRKIKKSTDVKTKLKFKFLDVTIFNYKMKFQNYKELLTLGADCKLQAMACLRISPDIARYSGYLERDILELDKKWIPPLSSNVMSGNDSGTDSIGTNNGGRPPKDATGGVGDDE